MKKSTFFLIFLAFLVFFAMGFAGAAYFQEKGWLKMISGQEAQKKAVQSDCSNDQQFPISTSSPSSRIVRSPKQGIPPEFSSIPIYPGISQADIWTNLESPYGIFFSVPDLQKTINFYEEKFKEKGWSESERKENSILFKIPQSEWSLLFKFIDKPTDALKKMNFKDQPVVAFYFQ